MLAFAAAVFFLIITPGPGVLSLAGVGSAFGYAAGRRYLAGLCVGTNIVGLAVVTGVAASLLADERARAILLYASVAYLFYLAVKIAFSGSRIAFIERQLEPGFIDGFTLQFINPKAYSVNTILFSGFTFLPDRFVTEAVVKFAIMNVIWIALHLLWLWAGVKLRSLNLPQKTQRFINIAMAASMLIVVGLAALAPTG